MDERKLQAVLASVHTGSFSKAAMELNFSQSAVSQMMNSFEEELGCRILERNHNGIRLTPEGEELLPYIVNAEASLTQLRRHAELVAKGRKAPIRIGTFSSISTTWLPEILLSYQKLHPEVVFDIRVGTDAISEWMLDGKIDLALGDARRCKDFRWYPLIEDPYYAILPGELITEEERSITQKEFSKYPLIMAPMNALDQYMDVSSDKQINVTCDNDSTLLAMVSQGLGVTAMPKLSLQNIPDNVKVLELIPTPIRVLGVAIPNSPNKDAEEFCRFLLTHYT